MKIRGVLLFVCILLVVAIVSGCFKGEQTFDEIDVPEETVMYEDDESLGLDVDGNPDTEDADSVVDVNETEETILREVYLLDADGFVVPQMLEIPKTESAALTTLQYMVKDGPVTEILPNGFQAVLPAHTEILGMNLGEDGTLIIDVSEQFTNYDAKDEVKILEAMSHTMTQFDTVERIKLWINGEELSEMPLNGTPISQGYSPTKGINVFLDGKPNLQTSKALTVYYPKQYHEQFYHVPVTQYFDAQTDDELFSAVVQSVMTSPKFGVDAMQVFNDGTKLVETPVLNEGVLQLVFNEAILKDEEQGMLADEVMQTLVKSLTAHEAVEAVQVKVEDQSVLVNERGTTYDRPVTLQDIQAEEKM